MKYTIIGDSCCDFSDELKAELNAVNVPLTMRLGDKEFVDDESLDLEIFRAAMKANKSKAGSAAPSPDAYYREMKKAESSFAVTLSSHLSASYSNALIAAEDLKKDGGETYVFDGKSASAGETCVAVKIKDCIDAGMSRDEIITTVEEHVKNMKTYFVFDNYDNLFKNGRLKKITFKIVSILNLKLIMGSDGDGNIKLFAKPRGMNMMYKRMMELFAESGKDFTKETLVIAHCNNPALAEKFREMVSAQFPFKRIITVPCHGLSTLYADENGIIMAF